MELSDRDDIFALLDRVEALLSQIRTAAARMVATARPREDTSLASLMKGPAPPPTRATASEAATEPPKPPAAPAQPRAQQKAEEAGLSLCPDCGKPIDPQTGRCRGCHPDDAPPELRGPVRDGKYRPESGTPMPTPDGLHADIELGGAAGMAPE